MKSKLLSLTTIMLFLALPRLPALARSTVFSYQGRLDDAGGPDDRLRQRRRNDGLFTRQIDFGQQYITAEQRHLEIEARAETGLRLR